MNPLVTTFAPLRTEYNDFVFRSRLEARWAVFMDSLGVPYEYEPAGYVIDGICYQPDFWLHDQDCFMEIKGPPPTVEEKRKAQALANGSEKRVALFWGQIEVPHETGMFFYIGWEDEPAKWCQCPVCGKYGIEWNGRGMRICWHEPENDHADTSQAEPIMAAYRKARAARFENGRAYFD